MQKVSPLIFDDALNFFRRRSRNRCRALFHLQDGFRKDRHFHSSNTSQYNSVVLSGSCTC